MAVKGQLQKMQKGGRNREGEKAEEKEGERENEREN